VPEDRAGADLKEGDGGVEQPLLPGAEHGHGEVIGAWGRTEWPAMPRSILCELAEGYGHLREGGR
jgi:hypothetical protein